MSYDSLHYIILDINECESNIDKCLTGEYCENTPGSYYCICPNGRDQYQPGQGSCQSSK